MADNEIIIDVKARLDSVDSSLKRLENKAEITGNKVEKELGPGLASRLKSGFKTIAVAAAAAFAAIAAAAVVTAKKSIEAANRQEDAINQLNQSLKSASTFSKEASESLQAYASELQNTTTLGDELVLEQLALARTFARSNEEAQALVGAAVELSAATGTELRSAVVNLGKSFAGLTGELGESVAEIRGLTAEQLKAGGAIDLVKNKFDGFAAAQRTTYSGSVKVLSNAYGDLLEEIGFLFTKFEGGNAFTDFFTKELKSASISLKAFRENGGFKELVLDLLEAAKVFNFFVVGPLEFLIKGFKLLINVVSLVVQAFVVLTVDAVAGLVDIIGLFTDKVSGAQATLANLSESTKAAFEEIGADTIDLGGDLFTFDATNTVDGFITDFGTSIENSKPFLEETGKGAGKAAADGVKQGTAGINFDNISTSFSNAANKIQITAKGLADVLRSSLVTTTTSAFAAFGGALAKGENAFAAFGKSILSSLGQLLIQFGTTLLTIGLGLSTVPFLFGLQGPAAVAAGLAAIVAGGALTALGGSGGGGAAAAGASAGGTASAPAGEATLTSNLEPEQKDPATQVTVNIQGDVLDSQESGTRIVQLINENFSTRGGVIASGGIA